MRATLQNNFGKPGVVYPSLIGFASDDCIFLDDETRDEAFVIEECGDAEVVVVSMRRRKRGGKLRRVPLIHSAHQLSCPSNFFIHLFHDANLSYVRSIALVIQLLHDWSGKICHGTFSSLISSRPSSSTDENGQVPKETVLEAPFS
jgi:hypothetical protein